MRFQPVLRKLLPGLILLLSTAPRGDLDRAVGQSLLVFTRSGTAECPGGS
jgi:hypothetical protein